MARVEEKLKDVIKDIPAQLRRTTVALQPPTVRP